MGQKDEKRMPGTLAKSGGRAPPSGEGWACPKPWRLKTSGR